MPLVLVVDDSPEIQELLVQALQDEGYQAVGAPNGEAALRILRDVRADVIILDYSMPVMDGPTFLENYRRRPGPHAAIILVTAAFNADERARELATTAYVGKPFDLNQLIGLIEEHALGSGRGPE